MSITSDFTNITKLNEEAINSFLQSPTKSVLKVGKDSKGHEYLEVKERGLWTWFASKILCLSGYQLEKVSDYVKTHNKDLGIYSLDNPKDGKVFYQVFNDKIRKYNRHYPNSYISTIKKKAQDISTPIIKKNLNDLNEDVSTPLIVPSLNKMSNPFDSQKNIEISSSPKNSFTKEVIQSGANQSSIKSQEPGEIKQSSLEVIKKTKTRLVNFYINQRARLEDLKTQLKTAKSQDKHKIQHAITKIESSDMARAKIALKVQLGKDPTVQELANYLGKSIASVKGFLLGQAYAQTIFNHTSSIVSTLSSLNPNQFGEYADTIKKLKQLESVDLEGLAKQLNKTKAETADLLTMLWSIAQELPNIDKQGVETLAKKIEEEVAQSLNTTEQDLERWLNDIHLEKELGIELNRLGEERKMIYPSNYSEATAASFQKHGIVPLTSGIWTFFQKGNVFPPVRTVKDAEQQWKLFVNPKREDFQSTLDRALRVMNKMPYINGKIVSSDTIKRKSDNFVLDDPCEPKLLFYFNGPNAAEDFKKAIQLLENEFTDADLIGAPAGQRNREKGVEEQWGPSFTKERNRLMFYTQGGYSESGRDAAVMTGTLADRFEGENFYLHKGFRDPLEDLPSPVYSMDTFLNQMQSNVHLFNQPLHLVKLQNILNKLNQDIQPSLQVQKWKEKVLNLMENVASNMQIQRQSSLIQLLDHWENMGDVNHAVAKTFYRELNKNLQELDSSKGKIKAQLNYLEKKAQAQIDHLRSLDISTASWQDVIKAIPPSFQNIFFNAAISDPKKLKELLIDEISQALDSQAKKNNVLLSSHDKSLILDKLREDDYVIGQHEGKIVLIQTISIFGQSTQYPLDLNSIVRFPFKYPIPPHIESFSRSLSLLDENQKLISITPRGADINLEAGIQLALKKIENVKKRQQERIKAYNSGEAIVIPHYYHATDGSAASSIAKTGVEAVQARSGFGAFSSTEPEFRYGYVAFGLPKTMEFTSKAKTVFDQRRVPNIITKETQVWAGLEDLIKINPRQAALQQNFASAIRQATLTMTSQISDLSNAERMEIEERLIQSFNRSVVFRAETGTNGQHVGWNLNYRALDEGNPFGAVTSIKSDEDLNKWAKQLIDSALNNMDPAPKENVQIADQFLNGFSTTFKKAYYHGRNEERNYVMPGQLTEKIKACLIASDDEFKEIYEKEYKNKASGSAKELRTLSEMEAEFKKAGIGSDLIEFIPLSEQLIERDFLLEIGETVPSKWK